MIAWRYAALSDVGLLREGNEDAAFAGRRLLAVADGMGGHAAGEVASAAVIAALEQLDELGVNAGDPQVALREAVHDANVHLRDMVAAESDLQGMGTTVTAVLTDGDYTWLAHVGDSRAYLLRGGVLTQLTRDHTFVQQLVDEGRIRKEDASTHPQRNFITRALDGREGIDIDLDRLDLQPGDRLLLCSDGLSGVVSDESMAEVLTGTTPEEAVQRLIDLALRGGGPDNITCIVADALDGQPEQGDAAVVGAASDEPTLRAEDGSPAARAAALRRTPKHVATDDGPDPRAKARRLRRRRAMLAATAVLVLFSLGTVAGYSWTQKQYYVAMAGPDVAIYQGVEGGVAGVELSHVRERVPLDVAALSEYERKRVEDGITAGSLGEARAIVTRLRAAATPAPTPSPTPKPKPSRTPTPSRTP
jgi:serine/threonine protein phosphatase PrpC